MFFFFFFNDTATTEIYTLSLHDALPISVGTFLGATVIAIGYKWAFVFNGLSDRKSTRLNSSHSQISYAVFCLKKKKNSPVALILGQQRISAQDTQNLRPRVRFMTPIGFP